MKKLIMVLMVWGTSAAVFGQGRVGYVDSQKILGALKETQTVQTQMQSEQQKAYKQLMYLQDSLNTSQDDYVKNVKDNSLLREGAKKAIEKGIQDLANLIQTRQQQLQEELLDKQSQLMQPILDKIKKAVETVRKANNLELILDSGYGIVLASDTKLDLTDKALEELIKMGTEKVDKK